MDATSASTGRPRGVATPVGVYEQVTYDDPHRIDARADDLQNLQNAPFALP
jgi:hypothetical protein